MNSLPAREPRPRVRMIGSARRLSGSSRRYSWEKSGKCTRSRRSFGVCRSMPGSGVSRGTLSRGPRAGRDLLGYQQRMGSSPPSLLSLLLFRDWTLIGQNPFFTGRTRTSTAVYFFSLCLGPVFMRHGRRYESAARLRLWWCRVWVDKQHGELGESFPEWRMYAVSIIFATQDMYSCLTTCICSLRSVLYRLPFPSG
jgi:hypothetical protein